MSLTNVLLIVIASQLTLTISEIEKVVRALKVLDEMLKFSGQSIYPFRHSYWVENAGGDPYKNFKF
jgi:hypothetical protein